MKHLKEVLEQGDFTRYRVYGFIGKETYQVFLLDDDYKETMLMIEDDITKEDIKDLLESNGLLWY